VTSPLPPAAPSLPSVECVDTTRCVIAQKNKFPHTPPLPHPRSTQRRETYETGQRPPPLGFGTTTLSVHHAMPFDKALEGASSASTADGIVSGLKRAGYP
jgi:hypothetical protein